MNKIEDTQSDSSFDSDFLRTSGQSIPPQFYSPDTLQPGQKEVEIVVNEHSVFKTKVNFISVADSKSAIPCLTPAILHSSQISSQDLSEAGKYDEQSCLNLTSHWPEAKIQYDESMQQLLITVPQAAMTTSQKAEMIDPSLWDDGVNALRLSYSSYVYHTENHGNDSSDNSSNNSAYLGLNSGLNLGSWRFYSFDTFNKAQDGWENNHDRAYAERDLASLVSRMTVGDVYANTSSDVLGVLPIRGISLETNNQMLPNDTFNYSPIVRGVARTNARVVIRQRGNIIYSQTVPAGSFAITDLTNGQIGADLDVTVEESDGSKQEFVVPYTSLPDMLRPGTWRYSLSAGRYRDDSLSQQPMVSQASLQYGFDVMTLSDLLLVGEGYQSSAISAGFNMGRWGSVSFDWALEHHQNQSDKSQAEAMDSTGHVLRAQYARRFDDTDTSLQLMGYRYQSGDFMDFSDYARWRWQNSDDDQTRYSKKNEIQVTLNQGMGEYGNGYFTLDRNSYTDTDRTDTSVTLGYSAQIKKVNVGVSYSYQAAYDGSEPGDRMLSLNFSVPLDAGDKNSRNVSFTTTNGNNTSSSQMATLSGTGLESALNYSLSAQHNEFGYTPSASMGYRNSMASFNASASVGPQTRQYSAGVTGGVVAYRDGIVLSQMLGDTVAIVETPGAENIAVEGQPGVKTNRWGKAVVPSIMPYRDNALSLNTRQAAENIELLDGGIGVIPTHGAVVVRQFQTRVGRRALVNLQLTDGKPAPFGAAVWQGKSQVGMVADNGLLYLSGVLAEDNTVIRVDLDNHTQCEFTLPAAKSSAEPWYQQINAICR
ncbi:fimbria/pilus outer membrane usher protein [Buttiauxella selenatireducens]|uniref:Fimbria/pilus outer membrane usher protein n=1 Tax=Buttiauxella selenatireducens TaxID=3073902 RepID=A0ABY9S8R7_9ENTR|nr:fimbria/pilus outer membrane usher protein [Buttiauxella sp. R73]WMY73388.1 fimbria/pilus outer membrane usher protein [Buttiauxella sp. R73]